MSTFIEVFMSSTQRTQYKYRVYLFTKQIKLCGWSVIKEHQKGFLTVSCNKKHEFSLSLYHPDFVCLQCNPKPKLLWLTEHKVRQILQHKLKMLLPKLRVYYNKSNKKQYYEFDGYNEEHRVAFEYHGYQHYIYPNHFHKSEDIFKDAQQRDKDKEQYCKDNNIRLLVIPYTVDINEL